MGDSGDLLDARNVCVSFVAADTVNAVDGIDLRIAPGEALGIVGESGSGKSVLTKSAIGLVPRNAVMTADSITFGGRDLQAMTQRERRSVLGREIGVVLQDPFVSLNPVVKVGRHFTEVLCRHLSITKAEARTRAIKLLGQVGIPSAADRFDGYPHELSGGMRQRVCIALAVACEPRLLIADEPTTALDVTTQRQILDLIDELSTANQMSTVLISHDLGIVAGRTQRLVVMYAGRIVETGPTAEIFANPRHRYTEALLAAVPRIDAEVGQRLHVIPGRPTLNTGNAVGCSFAPRCEAAQSICRTEVPPLTEPTETGHQHRCWFPTPRMPSTAIPVSAPSAKPVLNGAGVSQS